MKKFNIRLFGRGAWGKCEVSFNQEPTVKMVQDKVASCLKEGSLRYIKKDFILTEKVHHHLGLQLLMNK